MSSFSWQFHLRQIWNMRPKKPWAGTCPWMPLLPCTCMKRQSRGAFRLKSKMGNALILFEFIGWGVIFRSNWLATFYASIYWRVVGNAHEAIKCLKSSILKAPKNSKHIPLISLANVYHKARHSEKAVEVLLRADEYKRGNLSFNHIVFWTILQLLYECVIRGYFRRWSHNSLYLGQRVCHSFKVWKCCAELQKVCAAQQNTSRCNR